MAVESAAMTAAVAPMQRVARFGATERRLHTIHGVAFVVMLLTGLVLYLPFLAQIFSSRPITKAIHLMAAIAWLAALALVAILGDHKALRRTRRDLERFDDADLLWLRTRGAAPAGRFNAGQKLHAIAQAALAVLFCVSGVLLWLGERNTSLRLPGTIALHDFCTLAATVLVAGHVWIAMSAGRSGSLEGIRYGTVTAAYAARHHERWAARAGAPPAAPPPGRVRVAAAAIVIAFAIAGTASLVL
jgi:formate dehydrogenase subunit gamma